MREAAFPNFKKLYGVLYRADKPFTKGLPAGNYSVDISYSILFTAVQDVFFMGTLVWVTSSFHVSHCVHSFPFVLSAVEQLNTHIWTGTILRLHAGYFPLSSSLWSPIFSLDLCPSRLPCAVLPRQKGSGADHADLVWRSEPFPACCLPGNQQPDPTDSRHPHGGLVEVWEGWEEHGGMKGKTC